MNQVLCSKAFELDVKTLKRRHRNFGRFRMVIDSLVKNSRLDPKFRDNKLTGGNWNDFRECHVEPGWLLIYRIKGKVLELARTGMR